MTTFAAMRRSVRRNAAPAALVLSMVAIVSSFTGAADAAREALTRVVSKPRPNAVLKLGKNGKFPAKALPKVAAAKTADLLGELSAEDVKLHCNTESIDLGTWCMASSVFSVPPEDAGKNNFFYATQKCTELGGFLPSASQLIGAATRVKLQSYYTDSQLTASTDIDPADGLTDRREMSSTLITTQGGPSAAGLLGVSEGSRGNPRTGEPNPVVVPAVPAPDTLQYVTVVDNGERGGFAGSKPVGQAESFRCGFYKQQGEPELEEK